jgi:hypothetical protein
MRALGDDDIAVEAADLVLQVGGAGACRPHLHGLAAVGLFGQRGRGRPPAAPPSSQRAERRPGGASEGRGELAALQTILVNSARKVLAGDSSRPSLARAAGAGHAALRQASGSTQVDPIAGRAAGAGHPQPWQASGSTQVDPLVQPQPCRPRCGCRHPQPFGRRAGQPRPASALRALDQEVSHRQRAQVVRLSRRAISGRARAR